MYRHGGSHGKVFDSAILSGSSAMRVRDNIDGLVNAASDTSMGADGFSEPGEGRVVGR
jgi:hypothetical protein